MGPITGVQKDCVGQVRLDTALLCHLELLAADVQACTLQVGQHPQVQDINAALPPRFVKTQRFKVGQLRQLCHAGLHAGITLHLQMV